VVAGVTAPGGRTQQAATSPDGTRIAYWRSGHGHPLLLVHGATSDHTRWAPLLDLLEPHASVCAMDRRGRGGSGDAGGYSIEREFDDVAAVVDAIAQEAGGPVDVFGHSYGALCSLEATLRTTNVGKLALYEPPTHLEELPGLAGLLDDLDGLIAAGRREEAVERFFRQGVRAPDHEIELLRNTEAWSVRVANAHTMVREARALGGYDFDAARFGSRPVPTLLLVGGDHPPHLRALAEALAGALPDARTEILAGQQHMAMDTAPHLLVGRLLAFFDRAAPQ